MSSTASSAESGSAANGAARRTSAARSSTVHGLHRDHRHDLLGEHVQRVARVAHALDRARPASARRRRRTTTRSPRYFGKTTPRETAPTWWPGPAHPLQPGRDARRRLDLHDQVDRAHVDAQLQRARSRRPPAAGRTSAPPRRRPLLPGDRRRGAPARPRAARRRPMPGLRHRLAPGSAAPLAAVADAEVRRPPRRSSASSFSRAVKPLGQPPRVGEHDRRAVLPDQVEHPLLDRGPDRRPRARPAAADPSQPRRSARRGWPCPRPAPRPAPRSSCGVGGCTTVHRRAPPPRNRRHLVDRPDGRGQPDPLRRPRQQRVQPLQRQRQVGAALGRSDRVHLVDDHRLDAAQRLPRGRGEQQEQRLGRGDEDVRRRAGRTAGAPRPGCRRCACRP